MKITNYKLQITNKFKIQNSNDQNRFRSFGIGICILFVIWCLGFGICTRAAYPPVRIKDIAHVLEARENQLMGFGLVVGLKNTGDSAQTGFTKQALTNLLSRMGVPPQASEFKSRNVAAVMVTCNLLPFVKSGQKIDVVVSSLGDATSIAGGTLLLTPLYGPDEEIYAVAQGPVSIGIGGISEKTPSSYVQTMRPVAGRIPQGALVEREVPVTLGEKNLITIVLDQPDFTTATRIAASIVKAGLEAKAKDAGTVVVPFYKGEDPIEFIARIEGLTVVPDVVAKVVINERTGTIVIGENVRMAPVAISYQGISVSIGDMDIYSVSTEKGMQEEEAEIASKGKVMIKRYEGSLTEVPASASVSDLVKALNAVGATPKDLITILQAIKKAGALPAEIEVI